MIQVDDVGQNSIVIVGGANQQISEADVDAALAGCAAGTWLLLQNETSSIGHAIRRAKERGMRVAFNPAPYDERVASYPLELVDLLCVNETEAAALCGKSDAHEIAATLVAAWPRAEVVLTLGAAGVIRGTPQCVKHWKALAVNAIDTTAAGDTFLGYYLAGLIRQLVLRGMRGRGDSRRRPVRHAPRRDGLDSPQERSPGIPLTSSGIALTCRPIEHTLCVDYHDPRAHSADLPIRAPKRGFPP